MNSLVDIQSGAQHAYKFQQHGILPDFVKKAKIEDDLSEVPNASFADPGRRKFPCHTKAATLLSYLFAVDQKNSIPKDEWARLDDRFTKFSSYWGIRHTMQKTASAWVSRYSSDISDLPDDDLGLVETHNGKTVKLMPLHTKENVKLAATHLRKNASRYPFTWRVKAATKIFRRLPEGVPDEDRVYIKQAAGIEPAYPLDMARHLRERADLLGQIFDEDATSLRNTAANLEKHASMEPTRELSLAVAVMLDQADKKASLSSLYGKRLPLPEEACFNCVSEIASIIKSAVVETTTGDVYRTGDLVNAGIEPYAATDPELADSISDDGISVNPEKIAEIIPTLPLTLARQLNKNLYRIGIQKSSILSKKGRAPATSLAAWKDYAEGAGLVQETPTRFNFTYKFKETIPERAAANAERNSLLIGE